MDAKISATNDFAKTLRAFQAGSVSYAELLGQVSSHLDSGASPGSLLETLTRWEFIEPLPKHVHDGVLGLIENASPDTLIEAATIVLDDADAPDDGDATPGGGIIEHPPIAAGDVLLERFALLELIGHGGMSRVYKGIDASHTQGAGQESFVAVKVLNQAFTDDSGPFAAFKEAVAKLQRLVHPNIVRMLDCYRDNSIAFMTMEYVAGSSLYTRMHVNAADRGQRGLDLAAARAVIDAVADALHYAHEQHVIHGDLKPGNVLIATDGVVKVIDFGMATLTARTRPAVTPRYASPQLMARQEPGVTDDVYALACMAYELLTGTHPFPTAADARDRNSTPPLRSGLTQAEYTAVVNGLQRDRRRRTPSVERFMAEFRTPRQPDAAPSLRKAAGWALALIALAGGLWYFVHPRAPSNPAEVAVPALQTTPAPLPAPSPEPVPTQPASPAAGTQFRDCPTCPQMTVLPAGHFTQGSSDAVNGGSAFEQPAHTVALAHPPAFATDDVTVGDFRAFIRATKRDERGCDVYDGRWRHRAQSNWSAPGFPQTDRHPVTCVSYADAVAYGNWLSAKAGHRYRLPSAAEWEYAARAGSQESRPWDANGATACSSANVADASAAGRYPGWSVFACNDAFVYTAPVGSFNANAFGLNDMLGNVFQWTQDCWNANYTGAPTDGSARQDGDCSQRELRGGSWFSSPNYVRSTYRNHFAASYRASSVGFRVVRESEP